MHTLHRWVATAAVAVMVAALAACGGNDDKGSATAAGAAPAATSSGAPEAKGAVTTLLQERQRIKLPPLSRKPPSGKTVALISCPVPGCKLAESSVIPAAQLLGWKVKVLDGGLTPEKYVAAAEQALQMK